MGHPEFKDAGATIEFIRSMDDIFDVLNSRNPFAGKYRAPMKIANEQVWRPI